MPNVPNKPQPGEDPDMSGLDPLPDAPDDDGDPTEGDD